MEITFKNVKNGFVAQTTDENRQIEVFIFKTYPELLEFIGKHMDTKKAKISDNGQQTDNSKGSKRNIRSNRK